MKKLVFVFVGILCLTVVSGCQSTSTTVRFDENGNTNQASETPSNETTESTPEENQDATPEPETEAKAVDVKAENSRTQNHELSVTSMTNNQLETGMSYNVIRGKTNQETAYIEVNGYRLKKYVAGRADWNYIASTQMETLKEGANTYMVKAFDKSGKTLDEVEFKINYAAKNSHSLPDVGASLWLTLMLSGLMSGAWLGLKKLYQNNF